MRTSLVLASLLAALALPSGCYSEDCADYVLCDGQVASPPEPRCGDPAAGQPGDGCGVFVSSSAGSDDNPGTRALPVRSFAKAFALAQAGPLRVYACAELFDEPVEVPAGIEVWGGLDCAHGWAHVGATKKTTLAAEPEVIPLRLLGGAGRTILADVRAQAASATVPGGSSIAAMVMPEASVEILRAELIAGDGAVGAPGEKGGDGPAQGGHFGYTGSNACTADTVLGAPPAMTTCGDVETRGGSGGYGSDTDAGDGETGTPEPAPNPQGAGVGGTGQTSASPCENGKEGAAGASGEDGHGAVGTGRITLAGWRGEPGADGSNGKPGQGGGGGGGSRAGVAYCSDPGAKKGGASGGSGAAGGCGGRGGTGGGYGGASIGLVSLSPDVTVRSTAIIAGDSGDGGAGGTGQDGGPGGIRGSGGVGQNLSPDGCDGGNGGKGGNGGDGGGGLGGASLGIAHLVGNPPLIDNVTIRTGAAGKGGPGGGPAAPWTAGEDGISGDMLGFPQ